jgi:hypothetical protein
MPSFRIASWSRNDQANHVQSVAGRISVAAVGPSQLVNTVFNT